MNSTETSQLVEFAIGKDRYRIHRKMEDSLLGANEKEVITITVFKDMDDETIAIVNRNNAITDRQKRKTMFEQITQRVFSILEIARQN